ncbi:protein UXT homolog [Panonychus citri]|uniref:protein UXT homolog n=1 Tax=Panonychus citri TaxID=50023 RepID=UPI00230771CD|nr:protein UXT homolog [Panonychus citri]
MSFKSSYPSVEKVADQSVHPIVEKCETFINEQLKNDLKIIHLRQENIHVQLNNFQDLKSFILELTNNSFGCSSIKTQIDIGNNFYMRCTIPNTEKITIFIGLGFYLELSLQEALNFIDKRSIFLNSCIDKLSDQGRKVKAHIKVILDTLSYIQEIGDSGEKRDC